MPAPKDEIEETLREFENPREATPYIDEPDTKSIKDGSICWRDTTGNRVCGAECVAYNLEANPGTPEVCVLLVYKAQVALAAIKTVTKSEPRRDPREVSPPKIKGGPG